MISYSYNEIRSIRDDLYDLISRIEKSATVKIEMKMLVKEMKPYISEYNTLLNSMNIYDSITDKNLIEGFEKTQYFINALRKQQF